MKAHSLQDLSRCKERHNKYETVPRLRQTETIEFFNTVEYDKRCDKRSTMD